MTLAVAALGLFVFAIGASVGSFLNVVADRLPAGKSLVSPPSRCDVCFSPLSKLENLPILGFLWLRGRCRYCGSRIPVRVLVVEGVTAALVTVAYVRLGLNPQFVVVSAAISLFVVVAVIDWEHKLILNRLVFPSLVVALVIAPFWNELGLERSFAGSSAMLASLLNSVVAGVGAFLFILVLVMLRPGGIGGGDLKYAALLGLLLGFPGVLVAWWITAVVGAVVAVFLLVVLRKGRKFAIPYGPFMSLGGIVALLVGNDTVALVNDLVDLVAGV